ncbi:MAG: DEAD/DEAH box helicase [Acidobacteriota bacterium]
MKVSAISCVRHLIDEYRRFLRTSYRFLDPHLKKQFEEHLAKVDVVVKGPYVTLTHDYEQRETLHELVNSGEADRALLKANWPFGKERLYHHQVKAFKAGRKEKSFVVTTGTGSGKTEAFLLPVMDGILKRKRSGVKGLQAIFLYPMNALANDQLERLRRLLRGTGLDISFALYTGDSDTATQRLSEEPAETERLTRAQIRQKPPDILLTNYKQLEFLLVRKEDRALFTPSLKYLVLDELHAYRGALATEISCLIRRLKAHASIKSGDLLGIGTSATVASGANGSERLAFFASTLFGEEFHEEEIIGEVLRPQQEEKEEWIPDPPNLDAKDVFNLDIEDDENIIALAEKLTGQKCRQEGLISEKVSEVMSGNAVVKTLEEIFSNPTTIEGAVSTLKERFPNRSALADDTIQREIEAYLLVGSIGDEDHPPRLRPKLHTFFHGVYDVALCLNPDCRLLVPQGGTQCYRCASMARPAALCRTCGQDFVKVRFERDPDDKPVGTGDFYSDQNTAFLTHQIHELPEGFAPDEEESEENQKRMQRREEAEKKLDRIDFCLGCGRILPEGEKCRECNRFPICLLIHRGKLNTCPACGDTYTRGDIVTPLRTGTASTVSVLSTHHLEGLEGGDRRLLVFADNRQDVAHQAGYASDKHRTFALRHVIAQEVKGAGDRGVYLQELPQRLFDHYRKLGIIPRRTTRPERERWLDAFSYETANEFTRYSRQRASLENLGLVAIDYEFLDEILNSESFLEASRRAGLEISESYNLVRAILDVMRKNRAVAYDFFQEYIDPARKRRYRELESEPYNVRFPDRDRTPKAFALNRPAHIRSSGRLMGFYQENPRAGQLTASQKLVDRLLRSREKAEEFICAVVPILESLGILVAVKNFPIPRNEMVQGLKPLQIDPRLIFLVEPEEGYRCNACQTWRPYDLPTCPTPKCSQGKLQKTELDSDNYYIRLYLDHPPMRMKMAEHSAQISGEERATRETDFKEGRLDALVCTPTLELGVDIGPLLSIVLRNAPPTPTNYIQRVGRAGRRLRIGFVSTFCAGGSHDRHAFENPSWLVAGQFDPPKVRLDNPYVVYRHLRSYLMECIEAQLPNRMGELLDNIRTPSRWKKEDLQPLFEQVKTQKKDLISRISQLFAHDRDVERIDRYGMDEAKEIVEHFEADLCTIMERWWQRVRHLDREFHEYSTIGSPRHDEKKASARKRAYREITEDPERAYTLNYLSTQGFLPAYQFPVDTYSLDPGVSDTPTLYRPSSIAIEEFAPGNFVYANGHKLKSIRVLFAGGPGSGPVEYGRSDAETSGRLKSFIFCKNCDEVLETTRNRCPRCSADLPAPTDTIEVDSFEAEESLRIGSDEESRQRRYYVRRESLLSSGEEACKLFPYPMAPLEYRKLAEILITNWGHADSKTGEGFRFTLCLDCGKHMPYDLSDPSLKQKIEKWNEQHSRFCRGSLASVILSYRYKTDCIAMTVPGREDTTQIGRWSFSPSLVTLAEAILAGAENLLELEPFELSAFVRPAPGGQMGEQIVIYETVPGGAGYVEEMARRLPEVARAAQQRLYGHFCAKACYLCLKHYRNQKWHPFFDKNLIRDVLFILANQEPVKPQISSTNVSVETLKEMLEKRKEEAATGGFEDPRTGRYRKGKIEEPLGAALARIADLPPSQRDLEIKDGERLITVPDFAWEDVKVAVYCDGFAVHGNIETLELDARKRNWLQSRGWVVLTYWGRTILKDPDACAREIAEIYGQRRYMLR